MKLFFFEKVLDTRLLWQKNRTVTLYQNYGSSLGAGTGLEPDTKGFIKPFVNV